MKAVNPPSSRSSDTRDSPWQHRLETTGGDSPGRKPPRQSHGRVFPRLVRQLEHAPVHAERHAGIQIVHDLNSLFWIDMLGCHEPAWVISTDRQDGEIGRPELMPHRPEDRAECQYPFYTLPQARTGLFEIFAIQNNRTEHTMEGFAVEVSAESLGRQVTASVVKSIFMVIVVDGLFAMFFASIEY